MDLGELGFWLAAGIALAAWIISEGLKERAGIREKNATIREIMRLEAEGKAAPETLKYLREHDEAEKQRAREAKEAGDPVGAGIVAFFVGLIAFVAGLAAFALPLRAMDGPTPVALAIAIPATLLIWAGGLWLAVITFRAIHGRKKKPPQGG